MLNMNNIYFIVLSLFLWYYLYMKSEGDKVRLPKLDKEIKIYILIVIIIFLWILFLPDISALIRKIF